MDFNSVPERHADCIGNLRFSDLSPTWQRIVLTMSGLEFGVIEGLMVRGGEPVLDPPPTVIREIKFSETSSLSARSAHASDFLLRKQVVELVVTFSALGDETIDRLEVRHGLPHRIVMRDRQLLGRRS